MHSSKSAGNGRGNRSHFTPCASHAGCADADSFRAGADCGACAAPQCPMDANGDSTVGVDDLLLVLSAYGNDCGGATAACPDVDGDGAVNVEDLLAVLSGWGDC